MSAEIMLKFLEIQSQIKIMHWQTKSYARHKAFDDLYGSLDGSIDAFMEGFMGKYGRPVIGGQAQLTVGDLSALNVGQWIKEFSDFLITKLPSAIDAQADTDLLNIRDEMLASMNKLKYLLTLK